MYTIVEPTDSYLPSDNLSWYKADSSDKNEPSFSYYFRLQVTEVDTAFTSGPTGDDVAGTFRVPPRPVTGEAWFSPNSIVRNYTSREINYETGSTVINTNDGLRKYRITYGQEWVDTSTGPTSMDEQVGATFYTWNAIFQDAQFPSYDETNYVITPASTNVQFLTDSPNTRCVLENDNLYAIVDSGAYPSERFTDEILNGGNDFTNPTVIDRWEQAPNPVISPWFFDGAGITVDLGGDPSSNIMYYDIDEVASCGPVWTGDEVSIKLDTNIPWAQIGDFTPPTLMGRNRDGLWSTVKTFVAFNQVGIANYQVGIDEGDFAVPQDYQMLGIAILNDARQAPILTQIPIWVYNAPSPIYWYKDSPSYSMPYRYSIDTQSRVSYINAGTDGIGDPVNDYSVYIANGATTRLTEIINFTYDCNNCANCDKVNIAWLNTLGGFDTFEFNCLSAASLEVERSVGERTLPQNYTVGQRGRINPNNIGRDRKKVTTNFTDSDTVTWLESLMMSPSAYEIDDTGMYIPITIDTKTYSRFVRQDKLKLVEFEYSLGYNRKSQTL